ncbi:acyl-CoA dehydrogenase family protein [Saccharopolyspora cebuensis]|uniref:Acyl-CoA dehydrogenase family protein n=1 Tax=Saccharopolyspora cebuensis TaxID=418759 RepID=A0ABV4CGY9_9PSEU
MSERDSLIADVAADVLGGITEQAPEGAVHPVWPTLVELGWPQVGVPEDAGGAGGSLGDLVELISATAASGVSVPLVDAALSHWLLGERCSGLVVAVESLRAVPWGRHADRVLLRPADGPARFVDPAAAEVVPGLDLAGAPRDEIRPGPDAFSPAPEVAPHRAVRARAGVLNAAALLGAARGAYELTRRHVTEREQFGRPLVAIKAVASGLAEMQVRLVAVAAVVDRAVAAHERGTAEEAFAATAAARISAAGAATDVAAAAHQLHGAMGVTREHPLHHRTRKLWAWRDDAGSEREWSLRLGREALAAGEIGVWERLTGPG